MIPVSITYIGAYGPEKALEVELPAVPRAGEAVYLPGGRTTAVDRVRWTLGEDGSYEISVVVR